MFNNFFIFEKIIALGDIFKGFEKEGTETKHENRQDYMNRLKDSFLNYPFVLSHFENPEKVNASYTVNSDGVI